MYAMSTAVRDETASLSDPSEAVCTPDGSSTHRTTPEARAIAAGQAAAEAIERYSQPHRSLCTCGEEGTNATNGDL